MSDTNYSSPARDALVSAERLLADLASKLGQSVSLNDDYASAVFAGGRSGVSAELDADDLPSHVRGIQVGRYAVLLTLLPELPEEQEIGDVVRRVRNQCVVAKSYVSPAAALDLHAILIGPRGSERSDKWKALSLIAERDDRVARKLVWLRPADSAADEASFLEFAKRTFLARPWDTDAVFSMASLDSISTTASSDIVPREVAEYWIQSASEIGIDAEQLVDQLVESWQQRSES